MQQQQQLQQLTRVYALHHNRVNAARYVCGPFVPVVMQRRVARSRERKNVRGVPVTSTSTAGDHSPGPTAACLGVERNRALPLSDTYRCGVDELRADMRNGKREECEPFDRSFFETIATISVF